MNTYKNIRFLWAKWSDVVVPAMTGVSIGAIIGMAQWTVPPAQDLLGRVVILSPNACAYRTCATVAFLDQLVQQGREEPPPSETEPIPSPVRNPAHTSAPEVPDKQSPVSAPKSAVSQPVTTPTTPASEKLVATPAPVISRDFPEFGHAVFPLAYAVNWGNMYTPAEWNRDFSSYARDEFVPIPAYDMKVLTTPMSKVMEDRHAPGNVKILTAKLFWSTRLFGDYDLDSPEFRTGHAGVDMKAPKGMPVRSVAGGKVHDVRTSPELGLHVIIEHHPPKGGTAYSIYGHLGTASVKKSQTVRPGSTIGTVGMTGNSSNPHLHFQVDIGSPNEEYHTVYMPSSAPSKAEAYTHVEHPVQFILDHR